MRSRISSSLSVKGAFTSRVAWLGWPALNSASMPTAEHACPGVQ